MWTDQEKPILEKIKKLRQLPDEQRASATRALALQVRQLPKGMNKVRLAEALASLSTEGDFGHDTLQEVATTLADALRENPSKVIRILKDGQPPPERGPNPAPPYVELAELARYEHVDVKLDDPEYAAALALVDADQKKREQADFTLSDLQGRVGRLARCAAR